MNPSVSELGILTISVSVLLTTSVRTLCG